METVFEKITVKSNWQKLVKVRTLVTSNSFTDPSGWLKTSDPLRVGSILFALNECIAGKKPERACNSELAQVGFTQQAGSQCTKNIFHLSFKALAFSKILSESLES